VRGIGWRKRGGGELRVMISGVGSARNEQKKTMMRYARTGEIICDKKEGRMHLVAVGNVG
jgi:hypothetical protein